MHTLKLAARYAVGFAGLRQSDILLSSFPRSGSTWLRFLLCNLISLQELEGRPVDFPLLNSVMVELGVNNLLKPWPYHSVPRIIKTHRDYVPLFGRHLTVGIVRDPRDVIVSLYHFLKHRSRKFEDTFTQLVHHKAYGLEAWFRHYASWQSHWDLTIHYEALRDDTFAEFTRLLDALEISWSPALVGEAIARSNIQRVRAVEEPLAVAAAAEAAFARNGQNGQWPAYFNEDDLHFFYQLAERFNVHVYP